MSVIVPDGGILCENDKCKRVFYKYVCINDTINIDEHGDLSEAVLKNGLINRVTCPFCQCNFTVEMPLLIFSQQYKIYAAAALDHDMIHTSNFQNALRIAGAQDLKLRITKYAFEASEKVRLAALGIDDAALEMFKLVKFPQYRDMRIENEYIVFDSITNGIMKFVHCDYTDKILNSYEVPVSEFNLFSAGKPGAETGKWLSIDKDWAANHLED